MSDACEVPSAMGGGKITSISGDSDYVPRSAAGNMASMFVNVRACATGPCVYPTDQEHLLAHQYTAKDASRSGTFADPLKAAAIMFVFDDDLPKPSPRPGVWLSQERFSKIGEC